MIVHMSVYVFVPIGFKGDVCVAWRVVMVDTITIVIIVLLIFNQVLSNFIQLFRFCDFVQDIPTLIWICIYVHIHVHVHVHVHVPIHILVYTIVQFVLFDGGGRLRAVVEGVIVLECFRFC